MQRKKFLPVVVTLFALFVGFEAFAQNKIITGTVTDDKTGQPLYGVTVEAVGTNTATSTDSAGAYNINVLESQTILRFSYVGYDSKDIPINGETLNVTLLANASSLDNVVVIGYGSVRKKDLTGAVSTISSKDFNPGLATTPDQLLANKVPGVTITPNGGQPGQGSTIRIRQGASLNASNDPLIVVDGVPVSGGLKGDGTIQNSGISNALALINPDDIESFDILKDASSAAIYGSRASNGVILITTKKGKSGKPVVTLNTQFTMSKPGSLVKTLSGDQVRDLISQYGSSISSSIPQPGQENTDWQKEIYRTAWGTNDNISIAGSIKKLPYRFSVSYYNQQGILLKDNLQRYTGGLRLNPKLFQDHLKVDINVNGAVTNSIFGNQDAILNAILMDPTRPIYQTGSPWGGYFEYYTYNKDDDGNIIDSVPNTQATRNPLALLQQKLDEGKAQKLYGNVQLDYKFHFLPDLHANLNVGYEGSKGSGGVTVGTDAAQSWGNGTLSGDGYRSHFLQKINNKTLEFYLSYNKDITSIKSNINAVAGYGYYDYLTKNYNYPNFKSNGDTIAGSTPVFPFDEPRFTLISYYGRLIYTFNDKYILSGSLRTDGSSRFAPENRWGVFPSLALTWKLKQEDFLLNASALSNLNLRLSYGKTGNQDEINLYSYIPNYSYSGNASLYQIGSDFYHVYAPVGYNADLTWEKTATYNIGVDYGFLHNRINGSVDFYVKKTTDLLNNVNVTPGTNFANQITANVGSMNTKGVELTLNLIPVQTGKITWNIGLNASYNERKITKLTLFDDPTYIGILTGGITGGTGSNIQITSAGYQPNAFYVYKQAYGTNGKPLEGVYVDVNDDGLLNESDFYRYQSPYPKWTFGFNTSVTVDKWTLSTVLHSNIGNYVYNNVASSMDNLAALYNANGGTLQNSTTGIYNTLFSGRQLFSDYYVQNASFLKMDNLNLVYNGGRIFNNRVGLQISATAQNVFTVTKYPGINPEIYNGIDNKIYPMPRMYVLGLNFRF